MNKKIISRNLDKYFIFFLILIFFLYNFNRINYGLPFFINLDENAFQYSSLAFINFVTGYKPNFIDPIIAPLLNIILILKSIFINELLFNSLSPSQIKSKIYFNPELFIFYGRIASLIIVSISIFILYLIFKKLKINFLIYSILLITFSSSLIVLDVAIINGKNSYYLLFFLLQLYFLIKYLVKIENFNFKSYLIFGLLASLAWGVNYWPAFISIYGIFVLHFRRFQFSKLNYLFFFSLIFLILGPILNAVMSSDELFGHLFSSYEGENFKSGSFLTNLFSDALHGFKILFFSEKNFFLLLALTPFFLINKNIRLKKEFLIIFFILFEPIILFSLAQAIGPQPRYFIGSVSIVLILTGLIFNELNKTKFKYLGVILVLFNFVFIYNNISANNKINNLVSKKHSFYNFNNEITKDKSKIFYLIDLGFQESLKQNLLYVDLYENNLIKKTTIQEEFLNRIYKKIETIKTTNDIIINRKDLKNDIVYFNYTFFEIDNLELFFNYIKKDFDYVVIEDADEIFYLSNYLNQKKIKQYVKKNFSLEKVQFSEKKIFLRSFRSVIHYFGNITNRHDFADGIKDHELEKIYGLNYALYKLN